MKTILLTLILLLLPSTAFCPELSREWTKNYERKKAKQYQIRLRKLYLSFLWVESKNYWLAYNEKENAGGELQIRPVMIEEVNRLQDSIKFELKDRWNSKQSFKIFAIKMLSHNPELDIVKACQLWNGIRTKSEYVKEVTSTFNKIDYLKGIL